MKKNIVIGVLSLLILLATFVFGYYRYPVWHPCPEPVTNTVTIVDTIIHHVPDSIPYTVVRVDSVIYHDTVFKDVDTSRILSDYFALYYYTRVFKDSLLTVTLKDVVSENKFKGSEFMYQILRPQQIVNNVYNNTFYSKYLYLGGTATFPDSKYSSVGGFYASQRIIFGAGYIPYQKGFNVTFGFKLARF